MLFGYWCFMWMVKINTNKFIIINTICIIFFYLYIHISLYVLFTTWRLMMFSELHKKSTIWHFILFKMSFLFKVGPRVLLDFPSLCTLLSQRLINWSFLLESPIHTISYYSSSVFFFMVEAHYNVLLVLAPFLFIMLSCMHTVIR